MLLTTSSVLLRDLLDPANRRVWDEFDRRYRPVLFAFARRGGLAEADAEDLAQETLARFVAEYRAGRYDPARGRLRSWIFGIARARLADVARKRGRRREERGLSALADLQDPAEIGGVFEAEWRAALVREAFRLLGTETRIHPANLRILEMLLLEGKDAPTVARELGIPASQVHLAKHRSLRRLRALIEELERDW